MYKKAIWVMFFCLAGCVAVTSAPDFSFEKGEELSIPLTNIEKVEIGMTSNEVDGIMGETINIGYSSRFKQKGTYEEILVNNPYAVEILEGGLEQYRVLYYLTHIHKADGVVTDDELTPLVFENDRLIGKGQKFLSDLRYGLE